MKAQRRQYASKGGSVKNTVNNMVCAPSQAKPIKNAVATRPKAQGPAKIKGTVSG